LELFDEIKLDYKLCINESYEYKRKVNSISELLFLKGNKRLIYTDCPVFVVGKYETAPIVKFGINPGYSSKNNPTRIEKQEFHGNITLNFMKIFITILKVTILNHHIIMH
jgi:hypothetical protein